MSDKPPRRAPSVHMDDDARAEIGRSHRKQTSPAFDAVPAPTDPDQVTSPVALLLRELSDEEQVELAELIGARQASPDSPVTYTDLIRVTASIRDLKKQEKRDRRISADQTMEVLGAKGPPLDRLAAVERKMRVIWALLSLAGTAAGGSIIVVGKGLYERGDSDGAQRVRFDHVEHDTERLQIDLRELRDRLDDLRMGRTHRDQPVTWPITGATVTPSPKGNDKP